MNTNSGQIHKRRSVFDRLLITWAYLTIVIATALIFYVSVLHSPTKPNDLTAFATSKPPVFESQKAPKRNLIFMVSDGMGPASLSMARSLQQHMEGVGDIHNLFIDDYFVGNSRTSSASSLITDSAAGATAFSCGFKTYNGAIGLDASAQPCGTILEAAKDAGYLTGMVVTTYITDATPASFSTHAHDRSEQQTIAAQLIGRDHLLGRSVDLLVGGGRCEFLPTTKGGCRGDSRDLLEEAVEDGWSLATSREDFDALRGGTNASLPLLALLSNGQIPFDIDRLDEQYPSLVETTKMAITALTEATSDSDKGFFLLIEGSRIDHGGHLNDPTAQVHEVLAYNEAFKAAVEFAQSSDVETVVVSTSDHETGGLTVGRQVTEEYPEYVWFPEVLANAQHSTEFLAAKLRRYHTKSSSKKRQEVVKFVKTEILGPKGLNLDEINKGDVRRVIHHRADSQHVLADIVSIQAEIGWSTHGHTAVDVNVYGYAQNQELLHAIRGGNENIDFAEFMSGYLGVNLRKITKILKAKTAGRFNAFDTAEDPHRDPYHGGSV